MSETGENTAENTGERGNGRFLATVTNLIEVSVTETTAVLAWDEVPRGGSEGLRIYSSDTPGGTQTLRLTLGTGTTSGTVTGLVGGTSYTFWIKTYNSTASSADSNYLSVTTEETIGPPTGDGIIFFDDFRGGAFGSPVIGSGSYQNSPNCSVVQGNSLTGNNSVRMAFTVAGASRSYGELNFRAGQRTKDVWTKFVVLIPFNYTHVDSPGSDNNKAWVWAWAGDYVVKSQTDGVKLGGHLWRKSNNYSEFVAYHRKVQHINGVFSTQSHNYNTSADGTTGKSGNGVVAADRQTWIEIITRFRVSDTPTSRNGVHQMWKRSANGSLERQINIQNGDWWSTDADGSPEKGMDTFRFLGATNANLAPNTYFYVDSITVSTQSLL